MKAATIYILTIIISFSMASCGGGDDAGNASATGNQVQPTAQITNIQQSASAISAPASQRMASGFLGGSLSSVTPLQFAGSVTGGLFQLNPSSLTMQLVDTNFCITGSVSFPAEAATSGAIVFNICQIAGSGLIINGLINFNATQSDSGINLSVNYDNFTIADASQTLVSLSGTFSMILSFDGNNRSTTVADSFNVMVDGEVVQIDDYMNSIFFTFDASENTVSFNYAVTSSLLGGTLIVTTDPAEGGAPLVQNTSDFFPYTGIIIIIGADNDRVRITINGGLATDSVVFEYALDGDGVYDDGMESISWSDFEAQAQYALGSGMI